MATGPSYRVAFRRRREGRTDYQQRRSLVVSGLPRVVIRGSLRSMSIQLVKAEMRGDSVIVSAHSNELAKTYGWQGSGGSLPAAYLTGFLCGYKAIAKGVNEAVLDLGLQAPTKGSRVFAALKGTLDSGVVIPHNKDKLPDEKRVQGVHVSTYAKQLSASPEIYQKQFSEQLSKGLHPEELAAHFLQVKQKISMSFVKPKVPKEKEAEKEAPVTKPAAKRALRKVEKVEKVAKTTAKPRAKKSTEPKKSVKNE